jgi:DNA-binding CsgD family transcriptional regulator/PAS domain-containing protein
MTENKDYKIFFEFINNYSASGFREIDNNDQFMGRLNTILSSRQQFFIITDVTNLQILYTSPQVFDIFGIEPEQFELSYNFTLTHHSDIRRRSRSRARVIEAGHDLFMNKSRHLVMSSNFKMMKITGEITNVLVQCYLFYSNKPIETVYIILITTPIDLFQAIFKKGHFHWYEGNDLNFFRFPDEELLYIGTNLSERELEVVMCIHKGMQTDEICKKLFLSPLTIFTHRRNILKKTGKSNIYEVIFYLERIGII